MASAELSRRVGKVVAYPPLCEMADQQRREFHEVLLDPDSFEDLPGKWQAAIVTAEQNRPKLRVVRSDLVAFYGAAGTNRTNAVRSGWPGNVNRHSTSFPCCSRPGVGSMRTSPSSASP
jgi:hypothetical protein